uniref:Uncharacterized protein n=1 Tax=Laticauda laticaudata TaxID=8630 RepID=A0A8C5SWC0_LATLA
MTEPPAACTTPRRSAVESLKAVERMETATSTTAPTRIPPPRSTSTRKAKSADRGAEPQLLLLRSGTPSGAGRSPPLNATPPPDAPTQSCTQLADQTGP